jgi:hypothetical protein
MGSLHCLKNELRLFFFFFSFLAISQKGDYIKESMLFNAFLAVLAAAWYYNAVWEPQTADQSSSGTGASTRQRRAAVRGLGNCLGMF